MNTQPEALRLAAEFDWWVSRGLDLEPRLADAAAELRRLYEANQELLTLLLQYVDKEQVRAAIAKHGGAA
jgi:hypothetical protein